MSAAIPVLDDITLIKDKASKGAARMLLGKVYLYQNKFLEAADIFDEVINSGIYALLGDYEQLFYAATENNSETVFDVESILVQKEEVMDVLFVWKEMRVLVFQGIRQYVGPVYGDETAITYLLDLYDAFASFDVRRDVTVLDLDAFIAEQDNPDLITYAIGAGGHTDIIITNTSSVKGK